MTVTLTPKTEAKLLAWAEYEGQDADIVADVLLADALARVQAEEVAAIRVGLEDSDAGRVRPLAEIAAKKCAKYNLPTHLSDDEIFADEEQVIAVSSCR
ncbi:MAG: hypothetical protein ACRYFS_11985 [Janthinobacterium lividum]